MPNIPAYVCSRDSGDEGIKARRAREAGWNGSEKRKGFVSKQKPRKRMRVLNMQIPSVSSAGVFSPGEVAHPVKL